MKNSKQRIPIVILGLSDTGLYVAQSIAKYGIPIWGYDHDNSNPGFYSRYIVSCKSPHPYHQPQELLHCIINQFKGSFIRPILIPSSEAYLGFLHKYRFELEQLFQFIIPTHSILANILSKKGQFILASNCKLNVPDYSCITSMTELNCFLSGYSHTKTIIKALDQTIWKAKINKKAYVSNNINEIKNIGTALCKEKVPFIIQSVIEGPCTNNFEFNALTINGKILESCVIQKLRQYPPEYGAACLIQTVKNSTVEEIGANFVIQNKIEGFSNTEFKFNPTDNLYYFIETNSRVWQQIRLTESNGQNFVLSYYNLITKLHIPNYVHYKTKTIKWVDIYSDLVYWHRFLRQDGVGLISHLRSYSKVKYLGLLYFQDIKPFINVLKKIKIL